MVDTFDSITFFYVKVIASYTYTPLNYTIITFNCSCRKSYSMYTRVTRSGRPQNIFDVIFRFLPHFQIEHKLSRGN